MNKAMSENVANALATYKVVIFDWDGTLMNSVDRIVSSMQAAAVHVGLTVPSNDAVKQIIGLSLPTALDVLFTDLSQTQIDAMIAQYKFQYMEGNDTPASLFEGAISLLESLKVQNRVLAVATGKGREGLDRVLETTQTKTFFTTTRCAGEMPSKPDPTMINSILAELNIEAKDAVMIGDTSHDLKMAQAAGVDSIGVSFGVHNESVLAQFHPKAIVHSITELQVLLTA